MLVIVQVLYKVDSFDMMCLLVYQRMYGHLDYIRTPYMQLLLVLLVS